LTVPFIAEWKEKVVIDHTDVKIVLPEGATNVHVTLPFDASTRHDSLATYLDVGAGRPVVVVSKDNLNDYHRQVLTVTYDFSTSSLIFEPLLIVAFFFAVFVGLMLLSRVNLNLYPEPVNSQAA